MRTKPVSSSKTFHRETQYAFIFRIVHFKMTKTTAHSVVNMEGEAFTVFRLQSVLIKGLSLYIVLIRLGGVYFFTTRMLMRFLP